MDPLTQLLEGPRARRAFNLRVVMNPPWSIDVRDEAPLTVVAVMTGNAWLVADDERHELGPGDVAIVRGPKPYRMGDAADAFPDVVIHPGQRCSTPAGEDVHVRMRHGIRTWGNARRGETTMLIGTYESSAELGSAVTRPLPRIAVVPAGGVDDAIIRLLEQEIVGDAPGQGSTVDRLLDVLLVHAVRAWVGQHPDRAAGWLAGGSDPLVARTLETIHAAPEANWTIDKLADRLHVSRATVAARFRGAVGEPPMTYLTNWRMTLACDLLDDPTLTTAHVASQVGYGSAFAFSTAFKRRFGVSPTQFRGRQRPVPRTVDEVVATPMRVI